MFPGLTHEEYSAALDAVAAELLWEAEFSQPPIDAFRLANRLGLVVSTSSQPELRGQYARIPHQGSTPAADVAGLVLLADEPRPERRHWAVAHEIGESAAHRVFARLGISPCDAPPTSRERVANGLASRLLLPQGAFVTDARQCDWDLPMLKQVYCTASHELIARRVLELFPGPAIVSVFDHGEITWRRTNHGLTAPPLQEAERRVWQACHEQNRPTRARDPTAPLDRVRCWPIHEPDWRREIMLTEVLELE